MNITLSLLFHVNNTQQHLHLYVAVKESFICLKDLVRKRGNKMSSGGGPSVQRSEYRQRTPSIATGIGAKKR
ncbi:hypothetical protein CISIN_1g038241mg [Citrus sinensis]|uniref:Uncharacterized protein n=1 Tax=Citrus sinensis TaxID=2711 RepID=A0A067EJ38_CITSI|nr:hypothetical protein CISIN_1g038241mg [Citrus sinensis]